MKNLLPFLLCFGMFTAATFKNNAQSAMVDEFNIDIVHTIRLQFNQLHWMNLLDSLRLYGNEMIIGEISIDGATFKNVGVRYQNGEACRMGSRRNPWHVELNYKDTTQNYQGHTIVELSNAFEDPSLVREMLGYEIAGKYFPAPKASYANVSVNGENRGVFINVEAADPLFLKTNFKSSNGALVKPIGYIKSGENNGCSLAYGSLMFEDALDCYKRNFEASGNFNWNDLQTFSKTLLEEPNKFHQHINGDKLLWMLAFNTVTANLASYSGKYSDKYMLYEDGPAHFSPFLTDLYDCFGGFQNTGKGGNLKLEALQGLDVFLNADNPNKPLIAQVLKNEEMQKVYLTHIRQICIDNFENGWYKKRAKTLQGLIAPYFYNSPEKGDFSIADFNTSLAATVSNDHMTKPGVIELMEKRTQYLRAHPALAFIPPTVARVKAEKRKKFGDVPVTTFRITATIENYPKQVRLYYRSDPKASFVAVPMKDDGDGPDKKAGDKVYSVLIDPNGAYAEIEYYIIAENKGGIGYSPANYMFICIKQV